MERNVFEKQSELTERLNRYRAEYYDQNAPSVSDEVYDRLFDELTNMEKQTGVCMTNSPTQTVGYPVVSKLEKTRHEIPLLSLDKTKSSEDLMLFQANHQVMLMLKLDGLTVKLTYENGCLVEAATRGDGDEGEDITHNACGIGGISAQIPYLDRLVVTGEAFIRPSDFEVLKAALLDSNGKPYKNGRNLAAGSVRLLDASVCKERKVTFMPFSVLEGYSELTTKSQKLCQLPSLGFSICKFVVSKRVLSRNEIEGGIEQLQQFARANDIPIDGVVISYNDIAFSKSCGRTEHHYKDGMAYKFEDEMFESRLQLIEWTPTRSGEMAPVAIFDGHPTRIHESKGRTEDGEERIIKTLHCDNSACETRRLRQFVHFVSQKAMDIEGLSEATLEKLIGRGWIHTYMDIYRLDEHKSKIVQTEGFGEKSWERLWNAIQKSRNTTFERYLISMDIPMIGNTNSKALCGVFSGSLDDFENAVYQGYDFTQLPDFGETLHNNIHEWFRDEENIFIWDELKRMMNIEKKIVNEAPVRQDNPFVGRTIVVTGKVEPYTREGMNELIASLGAYAASSVSRKTDYLVCGEKAGSKLAKARELGLTILEPAEFFRMAGVA